MKFRFTRSKKAIVFYVLGVIIILSLLTVLVYVPFIKSASKKRKKLVKSEGIYREHSSEINAVTNIDKENEFLKKTLKKYSSIKVEKVTSYILNSLLKASKKSGVEFISIEPVDMRDKNGFKYLKLKARTRSGFHELGLFLSEIRRIDGLFFVDNIEIENKENVGAVITSKIAISVYITVQQ